MANQPTCSPHPDFFEALFAFKFKLSRVFNDVLGLYDIDHIAICQINAKQQILTFSSTPALEFNLFRAGLWRFDQHYQLNWLRQETRATWEMLYPKNYFDELYYFKQEKYAYKQTYSKAKKRDDCFFIYSLASQNDSSKTQEFFRSHLNDFDKIGQYCNNHLDSLFEEYKKPA